MSTGGLRVLTDEAEKVSRLAREELGIGLDSPVPDLLWLLESEARLRVFILSLDGDDGPEGAYQLNRGEPFVLLNAAWHAVRMRFTLAHEYGHHALGHGARVDERID